MLLQIFEILIFPVVMWCPTKYLGRIGSAVFIGYKQTPKLNLYIDENNKKMFVCIRKGDWKRGVGVGDIQSLK